MSTKSPRLRSKYEDHPRPWPIGQIPDSAIYKLCSKLAYRIAIGDSDLEGNLFSKIYAEIIDGTYRRQNHGLSDVFANGTAWSAKTIKKDHPWRERSARIISGRNSPSYSSDIPNPFENLQRTGNSVLEIWNARVNEALAEFDELRAAVLIRNLIAKEFCIFESLVNRFTPQDYRWELNMRRNFEGFDIATGIRHFTWQHHGGQFTIHRPIPGSAKRFRITKEIPIIVSYKRAMEIIEYDNSWVEIQ